MPSTPRVSIGMPVYNGERFLAGALDSHLAQDYSDFEVIVCDNASDDGTEQIAREYAARDERVRYHRNDENLGAAGNYNRAFELARGDLFKWSCHDDLISETFLSQCVDVFDREGPSVVLVYPQADFIDEGGEVLELDCADLDLRERQAHRRLAHFLRKVNRCNPVCGLISADALRKTRKIGRFVASDYVLLAELLLLGEFRELPDRLFHRRVHPGAHRQANTSTRDLAAWFGAKGRDRLPPRYRLVVEYFRSISRSELGFGAKAKCSLTVAWHWPLRRMRVRAGAMRQRLTRGLRGPSTSRVES